MRKNGKYRFSLQFPAETEEQIQAGELLERLGNRKSAVVVAALGEYLAAHPALLSPECRVEIKTVQSLSSDSLREMVLDLLEEQLAATPKTEVNTEDGVDFNGKITEMLANLDMFQ